MRRFYTLFLFGVLSIAINDGVAWLAAAGRTSSDAWQPLRGEQLYYRLRRVHPPMTGRNVYVRIDGCDIPVTGIEATSKKVILTTPHNAER